MRVMVLQYQHQYAGKFKETTLLDFRFRENVFALAAFRLEEYTDRNCCRCCWNLHERILQQTVALKRTGNSESLSKSVKCFKLFLVTLFLYHNQKV